MKTAGKLISANRAMTGALLFVLAGSAVANPTNPSVVQGTATFSTSGNVLNVTNSHNAVINWNGFSIGINELTRFIQPSALSAVLNRVDGGNPAAIIGALQSNGRVLLINRNGTVFSTNGQIDLARLIASSLALRGAGLLAGHPGFAGLPTARTVIGRGTGGPATGGNVFLAGPGAANGDVADTPEGEKLLAAGKTVELVDPATPDLRVEIVAPKNRALRLGRIAAEAGRKGIYAGLMRSDSTGNADRVVRAPDGSIALKIGAEINFPVFAAAGGGSGWMDDGIDDPLQGLAPAAALSGYVAPQRLR